MRKELKVLRVRHGLTQMQMAEKLGVSVANYSLIENGKRKGSIGFWKGLQNTFAVSDGEMWRMVAN